jgi:hypothetical protein
LDGNLTERDRLVVLDPCPNSVISRKDFEKVFSDKQWPWKVLLGGFLLINPFLLALAPTYFAGLGDPALQVAWVHEIFPFILGFNVLSFWFPSALPMKFCAGRGLVRAASFRTGRSGCSRATPMKVR